MTPAPGPRFLGTRLAALDPSGGNLFALVLVATFLAPRLAATLLPRAPRH